MAAAFHTVIRRETNEQKPDAKRTNRRENERTRNEQTRKRTERENERENEQTRNERTKTFDPLLPTLNFVLSQTLLNNFADKIS